MDKRATLKDISEIMGVSVTTVYKALNNKPKVSEELRKEINRVAEELSYKPNRIAQALARDTLKIGVIMPNKPSTFFDYVAQGAKNVLDELQDYNVTGVIRRVNDVHEAQEAWTYFYKNSMSGVVACFNEANPGCCELQRRHPVVMPIVSVVSGPYDETKTLGMVYSPGEIMGGMAAQIICMTMEDKTRPTVVCIPDECTHVHAASAKAFARKCSEFGVVCKKTYIMDFAADKEWQTAEKILEEFPDVGGIYVGSNNSYILCKYFESKGLTGKVRIIGHDLHPGLADCIKSGIMTATFFQNQYGNVHRAIKGLVNYLSGEETKFENVRYRPEVVMTSNIDSYKGLY